MGIERNLTFMMLAVSGLLIMFIFVTGGLAQLNVLLIAFASFLAMCALVNFKYGYWVIPFLTKKVRVIEVIEEPPEVTPAQDMLIKKIGSKYYASVFLQVKIYESVTEKTSEQKQSFMELWERAVSGLKFVAKFTIASSIKDLTKYKESIEAKKADAQLKLANERDKPNPDPALLERYERETTMWENMVSKLAIGDKPISNITYVMTSGVGTTPTMAMAVAKTQANDIKSTISTALGVEVVLLSGEDMKKCFDWEHIMPPVFAREGGI